MNARTAYDIHSPFLFDFTQNVLNNKNDYYAFKGIELIRKELLNSNSELNILDYGAGSKKGSPPKRKISTIAKNTLITPKFGRLLFHLVNHYQSKRILELGTSLGISTLYLATASSHAQIVSLEGSPEIGQTAVQNFKPLHINNIELLIGEFSETLPQALEILGKIDLAFIDGNHRRNPTIAYFEKILPFCHQNSILVFDDIHWSSEMEDAWNYIKSSEKVKLTIDLFFKGIVFFNPEIREKTDVSLYF